jgi:hypothetical protein
MRTTIFVGRQYGDESLAYVGRAEWDGMRRDRMEDCELNHSEAEIEAALMRDLGAGIEGCTGGRGYQCEFYLDQMLEIEAVSDVLVISGEVLA